MSIQDLTAISRYYGANPDYVIAGGGNTSFKDETTLYIKGSGSSLAEAEPERFVRMDRGLLREIWKKTYPADPAEREKAALADMMAARMAGEEQKRPSVETLLHDILPFAFVVHTHPALVNGLTCSQDGEQAAAELFGGDSIWIPSTNPGYVLSRQVKEAQDEYIRRRGRPAALVFLQNHGVFVGADTTAGVQEQYRRVMETVKTRIRREPDFSGEVTAYGCSAAAGRVLGNLAGGKAVRFLRNSEIAALVKDRRSFVPVSAPFSPDHIVYAGSNPLFVDADGAGDAGAETIPGRIGAAWNQMVEKTGREPKIAAVQGLGVFGIGGSDKAAGLALELFTDAVKVAVYTEAFGGARFMPPDQIDFINNWEVERYRSKIAGINP
ncbi:MAG: class II aldolase/adducin family protein [Spirochaetaceae bacterium]|jgi:rhamnose utilization protein RhaD (predicted bifunctional aldolase and dehydrogenase)|nr:class II aldolase/adducin family protein [Spirochaetaceae bacterium]